MNEEGIQQECLRQFSLIQTPQANTQRKMRKHQSFTATREKQDLTICV